MTICESLSIESITSVFQPVVSMRRGKVVFTEGLGRGISSTGTLVSPLAMLESSRELGCLSELNFSFLEAALQGWRDRNEEGLLSINMDASCICDDSLQSLSELVGRIGLEPSSIILEICENLNQEADCLLRFVQGAKNAGFLIAIDDLGKEHSNLDRIISFEPDIIKLDRELIQNLHNDSKKRALVKAMTRFGNECGAQVVAEGVECWEEAFALLELGVDLFQGFYFSKPTHAPLTPSAWGPKTHVLVSAFLSHQMNSIRLDQALRKMMFELSNRALRFLVNRDPDELDRILSRYIQKLTYLECVYIVDAWGQQVSATHFSPLIDASKLTSPLFSPADSGDNHSLKDYFTNLPAKGSYLSEPYLSQATGNYCRTFTRWLVHENSACEYILCVDLPVNQIHNISTLANPK